MFCFLMLCIHECRLIKVRTCVHAWVGSVYALRAPPGRAGVLGLLQHVKERFVNESRCKITTTKRRTFNVGDAPETLSESSETLSCKQKSIGN